MEEHEIHDIAAQVESRTEQEEDALASKKETKSRSEPPERDPFWISDNDLLSYLEMNRVGDALLYARINRGKTVFVPQWNCQLMWAGHHWADDSKSSKAFQMIESVCTLYQRLASTKQEQADEVVDKDLKAAIQQIADTAKKRVNLLRDQPGQEKLLTQTQRIEAPLLVDAEKIDRQLYSLACPNGVVDLRTGELRDGKPEDYIYSACPTAFDPALLQLSDPCPDTASFLLRSMDGDQELVDFIWRLLGYGLIRERRDHIFVIFWGEHGRNGKDTLIKLVTTILGSKLSGDVPVEMFLQTGQVKNSSAASTDVKELCGMCIAWINEAEEGHRFALAKLKRLSGGGMISARGNYEAKSTTWKQTHLPIMTTNAIPKANADDNPFWHRALVVKWPLSFVDNPKEPYERKADKHLDDKVQAEAQGVLARMVQGALEYLRDGLKVPEKVRAWTGEQRASGDDAAQFFEEWCLLEEYQEDQNKYLTRVQATDLHEAFCIWYARYRDRRFSISAKKFADMLNKKNIPFKRSNGIWRLGIDLTPDAWKEVDNGRSK